MENNYRTLYRDKDNRKGQMNNFSVILSLLVFIHIYMSVLGKGDDNRNKTSSTTTPQSKVLIYRLNSEMLMSFNIQYSDYFENSHK